MLELLTIYHEKKKKSIEKNTPLVQVPRMRYRFTEPFLIRGSLFKSKKRYNFPNRGNLPSFPRGKDHAPPLRSLIFLPHYFFVAAEVGVTAHLAICLFARKSLGLCVHALALCVIAKGGGEEGEDPWNERGNFCDRVGGGLRFKSLLIAKQLSPDLFAPFLW